MHRRLGVVLLSLAAVILAISLSLSPLPAKAADTGDVKDRSQIETKYKWDLTDMYKTDADWEADVKALEDMLLTLKAYEGKVSKSPDDLLAFLKLSENAAKKFDNAGSYASQSYDQDTRDQKYTGYKDRLSTVGVKFGEATAWYTPELISIPPETLEKWYKAKPELAVYRHSFDDAFRQKKHTLSPAEERILAMAGNVERTAYNASGALRQADIKFPTIKDENGKDVQLSEGRRAKLLESPDSVVRRNTDIGILNTYAGFRNTAAALMQGNVAGHLFNSEARGYPSCVSASVDNDNIDTMVYLNLIETVKKYSATLQRYADMRRRALKLATIHPYDMLAPLIPETREDMPYDKAVATIEQALQPLGKGYLDPMHKGFNSRWIDVYETKNKRTGAYSGGSFLSHPYMLLNYSDTMDDMFTVAHEMGHSMHTWFSEKGQPYVYSGYAIFNAEVASTFNEALLMDYLLKKEKDAKKRLTLVNQYIDNIRGTVITQVIFADFELRMHRAAEAGEPLTADNLSQMYLETLRSYYGDAVKVDDEYGATWARVPHFYYNFYVYKYATSYCASQALSQKVLKKEKGATEAYLRYLSSGSSKYPIELLKDAGVDMTTPAPVEATMKKFGELVDEMEKLLKETKRI
jgi:oligoendopeptidase F